MNMLEYENTQETKTHGKPEFPFNIYPCSIPFDFPSVPTHWHNDMEIIYIKKGRGTIFIDLLPYPASGGDILFIAPGRLHSIEGQGESGMEYENIIFQLQLLMVPGDDICTRQFFLPLLHNQMPLPACLAKDDPLYHSVVRCLDNIDTLSESRESLYTLGIKGQLFTLFHLLSCQCRDVDMPRTSSKSLDTVKQILKHLEEHYPEKLSVEDMAVLCGFSKSHFMKFFKQHMGVSFLEYLNNYRLVMAARMLSASSDTIVSIAQETGFENLSYFNRLFKRKFGITPSSYRKDC